MSSLLESLQSHSGILMVLLLIVVIILLICVFNLSLGLNRLFKRKFDLIEKLVRSTDDNGEEIDKIWKVMDKSLNKYGIVKYDAFEDMGGKLSFVLAMLDKNNTGFLLNAIHSRENCFLYIKEIVNGESYVVLSEEEVEALRQAVNFGILQETELED